MIMLRNIGLAFFTMMVILFLTSSVAAQIPSDVDSLIIDSNLGYTGEDVSVFVKLTNTFSVSAVSMRITFDETVLSLISISLMERSEMLDWLVVDTSAAGVLRVSALSMFPIDNFILPDTGRIFEIWFHIDEYAPSGISPLTFENSGFYTYDNHLSDSTGLLLIIPVLVHGYLEIENSTFADDVEVLPDEYQYLNNYPNPFNNTTVISFNGVGQGQARLLIFNLLGRQIRTMELGELSQAQNTVVWDGRNNFGKEVASGVYCYALYFGQKSVLTNKMILLR